MTIGTVIEPINQQITCLKRSWVLSLGKCQCLDDFGQCEESVRKISSSFDAWASKNVGRQKRKRPAAGASPSRRASALQALDAPGVALDDSDRVDVQADLFGLRFAHEGDFVRAFADVQEARNRHAMSGVGTLFIELLDPRRALF